MISVVEIFSNTLDYLTQPANITFILSICGFATALSSLVLSIMSFKRDQGRLDTAIGIWQPIDNTTGKLSGSPHIIITAVNSGRRPVTVDCVGGFPKFWRVKKVLNFICPRLFLWPSYYFSDSLVIKALFDPSGQRKVLVEGQKLSINIPIQFENVSPSILSWDDIGALFVGDTVGRMHCVPSAKLGKFKTDIKKYL